MSVVLKVVCVCLLVPHTLTESCGKFEISYICHERHIDAVLKLISSEDTNNCKQKGSSRRWFHYRDTALTQIYPEVSTGPGDGTITTTLHDIDDSDGGTYVIDCEWNRTLCMARTEMSIPSNKECDTSNSLPRGTNDQTNILPAVTRSPGKKPAGGVLSDNVIVVIAVCTVIIVVVVAGTVLIILRRRNTETTETTHFANKRGSAVHLQQENESNIYNEVVNHKLEKGKVDNCGFKSSKLSLLSLQNSPALPKRPDQRQLIQENEDDYAIIRDSTIKDKDKNKNKSACVQIESKFPTIDNGYTKISTVDEHSKDIQNDSFSNGETLPEYTKVQKRRVAVDIENQPESLTGDNHNLTDYKVVFPEINCSDIAYSLNNDLQKYDLITPDEPATYCNIVSKRRQSKARLSRRELQYAILDHTGSAASLDALSLGVYDLPAIATSQIEYASIDFDKKAFVAPVRKAPSSWYKRRNKEVKGK